MNIIGIDPGLCSGAVALIKSDGIYEVYGTPVLNIKSGKSVRTIANIKALKDIIWTMKSECIETYAVIEKVASMPNQGVKSMFSLGGGYYMYQTICCCFGIPLEFVSPQTWKKVMMKGMGKQKDASVFKAQSLFPKAQLYGPRGRALHDCADALLIAEYGRRLLGGNHEV